MTILYLGTLTVPMLADTDITSLIAFVLFAIISVLGNALKKKAEAKRQQSDSPSDEEFDEIPELLSAGPSISRSVSQAPPKPALPLPSVPRPAREVRRPDRQKAMPNDVYDLVVAQIARKASQPRTTIPPKPRADMAVSETPDGVPERPLLMGKRGDRLLDAQTLRSAVVWSEILKPPLGLRDLPCGWQGAGDLD